MLAECKEKSLKLGGNTDAIFALSMIAWGVFSYIKEELYEKNHREQIISKSASGRRSRCTVWLSWRMYD